MEKRMIFNLNQYYRSFAAVLSVLCLMACNEREQWVMGDIPGSNQTAAYSNKLSAPIGGNELVLHYSDSLFIGKEVRFGRDSEGKGMLTLCGILPGELEYTVKNMALTPVATGYTFKGSATSSLGTSFQYTGKVEEKKLTLNLSEIKIPDNALSGLWYTLPNNGDNSDSIKYINGNWTSWYTCCNTVYAKVGEFTEEDGEALWDPTKIPSIVPLAFEMALKPVLSCVFGTVLRDVTFQKDGNITATYASLPDTVGFMQMMSGQGIVRNEEDWETSSLNLASYFPLDDTTICVLPHVDMIIRQIELNKAVQTKAGNPFGMIGEALDVYALLNRWSTTGIKLIVKKNDPDKYVLTTENEYRKYTGDCIVYIDKSEVEALYAILDIAKVFIPVEIIDLPLDELLLANGIDVEQAIKDALGPMGDFVVQLIMPLLHKFTINNLLTQIKADLDEDPLQIGIWLDRMQVAAE